MASLQLSSSIPLLPARKGVRGRRPRMAAVSCKTDQSTNIQGTRLTNHTTRRDTLFFMSSAMLAAFLVAGPAEARTSRLENKKRAMEKLEVEKIRVKALGLGPVGKDGVSLKDMPPANLLIPPAVVEASYDFVKDTTYLI